MNVDSAVRIPDKGNEMDTRDLLEKEEIGRAVRSLKMVLGPDLYELIDDPSAWQLLVEYHRQYRVPVSLRSLLAAYSHLVGYALRYYLRLMESIQNLISERDTFVAEANAGFQIPDELSLPEQALVESLADGFTWLPRISPPAEESVEELEQQTLDLWFQLGAESPLKENTNGSD